MVCISINYNRIREKLILIISFNPEPVKISISNSSGSPETENSDLRTNPSAGYSFELITDLFEIISISTEAEST